MGDFVNVRDGVVDINTPGNVGGENIILQQYNSSNLLVGEMKDLIVGYTDQLSTLLEDLDMPEGWTDVLGNVTIVPVTAMDPSTVPAPGAITLPGFEGVSFPLMPSLPSVPTIDTSYTEPTAPDDVNPSIDYMMATYTSDMWLSLFNKVQNDIDNGGTGLGAEVEAALYERDADRKQDANEKAYLAGVREIASKALSFPQYAMNVLANQMATEILRQEHASSNEIVISQAELAQKNTQFAVDKGIDMEKILRGFWEVMERLSLEAKKAVADLVITNYAEKNKAFIAKFQGIVSSLEAKVKVADAVVAEQRAIVEGFKAQTDGAIAQTEQISKERQSLVDAGKAEADIYGKRVDAQTAWYTALNENQKAQIQKAELELRKASEELKATLDSQMSINGIREKILTTLTATFSQVMASALNTVTTTVGYSGSSTESVGETWHHQDSLSENHSYDETKD